jgi:hypothetical protein
MAAETPLFKCNLIFPPFQTWDNVTLSVLDLANTSGNWMAKGQLLYHVSYQKLIVVLLPINLEDPIATKWDVDTTSFQKGEHNNEQQPILSNNPKHLYTNISNPTYKEEHNLFVPNLKCPNLQILWPDK